MLGALGCGGCFVFGVSNFNWWIKWLSCFSFEEIDFLKQIFDKLYWNIVYKPHGKNSQVKFLLKKISVKLLRTFSLAPLVKGGNVFGKFDCGPFFLINVCFFDGFGQKL